MQFVDLKRQYERIKPGVQKGINEVLDNTSFIMGPQVKKLEQELADYAGVKHVVSCSSGTSALVIPLLSYELKPTDAVFVPSFTFFATAETVSLAGGTPVFVDSDPRTFNMSPESLKATYNRIVAEGKLTPKGVITVDLFGQPADYNTITPFCKEHDLFLLDDAAQGFGGKISDKTIGNFSDVTATSFFPAKPLGCYGDGGAILTNNDEIADLCRSLRVHGKGTNKYDNVRIGINGRLDSIQAVVVSEKLKIFDDEIEKRNKVADAYSEGLKDVLETPVVLQDALSTWAQYSLLAKDEAERDKIREHLRTKDIPTNVYYPTPIHLSTAYKHLGFKKGDLPVCEDHSKRIFSLPMHPYITEEEIELVISTILELF